MVVTSRYGLGPEQEVSNQLTCSNDPLCGFKFDNFMRVPDARMHIQCMCIYMYMYMYCPKVFNFKTDIVCCHAK